MKFIEAFEEALEGRGIKIAYKEGDTSTAEYIYLQDSGSWRFKNQELAPQLTKSDMLEEWEVEPESTAFRINCEIVEEESGAKCIKYNDNGQSCTLRLSLIPNHESFLRNVFTVLRKAASYKNPEPEKKAVVNKPKEIILYGARDARDNAQYFYTDYPKLGVCNNIWEEQGHKGDYYSADFLLPDKFLPSDRYVKVKISIIEELNAD